MEAFLLLGIIPGTSIQINFADWLMGMSLLCVMLAIRAAHRNHLLPTLMILLTLRRATREATLAAQLA